MGDARADAWGGARAEPPLVLVIDDDPDARTICERTLRAAGYRTATVASGPEALARIGDLRPALVVLDLAMPGTDGMGVLRALRAQPALAATPILVFSGLAGDAEERAREAGGSAFCQKPIEPRRFLDQVRQLCPPR